MQCALDSKAKVEAAVLVAQRWLLAALRHRRFYHRNELNAAIGELFVKLNDRVMRHVQQSRRQLFERLDRPALKALPPQPYEYPEWQQVRVSIDYNVSVADHFYSAPYTLIHEPLWCRASHRTVELFHRGKRIASHVRSFKKYAYTTDPANRPASHRAHLEWTPSAHPVGTVDRAEHRGADRARHPQQAASRAGLPLRAGYPAVGQEI